MKQVCSQCHGDGEIEAAGGYTDTCGVCGGKMMESKPEKFGEFEIVIGNADCEDLVEVLYDRAVAAREVAIGLMKGTAGCGPPEEVVRIVDEMIADTERRNAEWKE